MKGDDADQDDMGYKRLGSSRRHDLETAGGVSSESEQPYIVLIWARSAFGMLVSLEVRLTPPNAQAIP